MMGISEFIEAVGDVSHWDGLDYDRSLEVGFNTARFDDTIINESMIVFHSDEELVEHVSTLLAEKHFRDNPELHDRGIAFYRDGYFTDFFRKPRGENYLRLYTLSDLGIKRFCILTERNLLVRYDCLPLVERMLIDNFINKCCVDRVVDKLSHISAYEIKKVEKQGFPFPLLSVSVELKHINTVEQLKMFLYAYRRSHFYLNLDLLRSDLVIEKDYVNLSYDDIPKYIDMDIFYEGEPWLDEFGGLRSGKKKTFSIRFMTLLNDDRSLSLKPHPEDIIKVVNRPVFLNEVVFIGWNNGSNLFIPERLHPLFSFLWKNNLEGQFGLIKVVYSSSESLKIANGIDRHDYYEELEERRNMYPCSFPEDFEVKYESLPCDGYYSGLVKRGYVAVEYKR